MTVMTESTRTGGACSASVAAAEAMPVCDVEPEASALVAGAVLVAVLTLERVRRTTRGDARPGEAGALDSVRGDARAALLLRGALEVDMW